MCPVSKKESDAEEKRTGGKKSSPKRQTQGSPRKSGQSEGRSQSRSRSDRSDRRRTSDRRDDKEQSGRPRRSGAPGDKRRFKSNDERSDRRRTSSRRDDKEQSGRPRRSGAPGDKKRFKSNDERSNRPARSDRHRSYDKRPKSYDSSEPEKKTKAPKVKKIRTEFGTRVARRITCTACGKSDTIDFVPQEGGAIVCRQCAYEKYNVHDPDRNDYSEYEYDCSTCGIKFKSVIFFEDESEVQCSNCYMGIETKQDDKLKRGKKVKSGVVRVKRRK